MFDNLVESTTSSQGTRTATVFAVTAALWSTALLTALTIGIVMFDAQLNAELDRELALVSMAAQPAPPPPPAAQSSPRPERPNPVPIPQLESVREVPPQIVPPTVRPPASSSSPVPGIPGGSENGDSTGEIGSTGFTPGGTGLDEIPGTESLPTPVPPPVVNPPDPPQPPAPTTPTRVSSGVLLGKAFSKPQPPYPIIARDANIEGAVVVEVKVGEDGSVLSARVLSGHPLLRDASVSAARRWRFSPTKLSNQPIQVVGTITFNFKRS